jgi:hypothetical protein
MTNLAHWKQKLEWKKEGKGFLVSVTKHKRCDDNLWCIYLYIYPDHPTFDKFNKDGTMWDQPHFDCHSYVSYFQPHVRHKTGDIASYQLGWDYNHDGDSYYTSIEDVEDAGSVFYDAEHLFKQASDLYNEDEDSINASVATCAYQMADAMIEARSK